MRKYETFFIIDPDLPDEATAVVDNKVQSIVTANEGQVLAYSPWGKRKLAYAIGKRTRGLYVLMEYAGGPSLVAELERNMRLDERVLKFITVKLEDRFDPEKEKERAAAAAAAALAKFEEEEEEAAALPAEAVAEGEVEEAPEPAGVAAEGEDLPKEGEAAAAEPEKE
jgi:small subunit ribosomal protein S6